MKRSTMFIIIGSILLLFIYGCLRLEYSRIEAKRVLEQQDREHNRVLVFGTLSKGGCEAVNQVLKELNRR